MPQNCTIFDMTQPLPGWVRFQNRKSGRCLDFNPRDSEHRQLMERFLFHADWYSITPPRPDDTPLIESLMPLGDGNRAVLTQMWPEGTVSAIGTLDPVDGSFSPSSGHFASFKRPATLISEDK